MELIDTWNISKNLNCQILLDIKIHQSITFLLIFNHLSHVLYYNIWLNPALMRFPHLLFKDFLIKIIVNSTQSSLGD